MGSNEPPNRIHLLSPTVFEVEAFSLLSESARHPSSTPLHLITHYQPLGCFASTAQERNAPVIRDRAGPWKGGEGRMRQGHTARGREEIFLGESLGGGGLLYGRPPDVLFLIAMLDSLLSPPLVSLRFGWHCFVSLCEALRDLKGTLLPSCLERWRLGFTMFPDSQATMRCIWTGDPGQGLSIAVGVIRLTSTAYDQDNALTTR